MKKYRRVQLGSNYDTHFYRASESYGIKFKSEQSKFDKQLDKNDCLAALDHYSAMQNWAGVTRGNIDSMGDESERLRIWQEQQETVLDEARQKFKFQCVVGGFAGLKRRRKN